jgi:hypothetical protein
MISLGIVFPHPRGLVQLTIFTATNTFVGSRCGRREVTTKRQSGGGLIVGVGRLSLTAADVIVVARLFVAAGRSHPISGVMQHLDLTDEEAADEAAALIKELAAIIESDRYPLSSRIRTLRAILAKLKPEPEREPLPPPTEYAPLRATAARRLRAGR